MANILIETAEDDCFIALARHIGSLLDGGKELQTSLAETPASKLVAETSRAVEAAEFEAVAAALTPHVPLLLEAGDGAAADAALAVIAHAVARCDAASALSPAAEALADKLAEKPTHRAVLRLQGLLELFNAVDAAAVKHATLLRALALASAAGPSVTQALAPVLHGRADPWERQWGLAPRDAAPLFAAIAAVLDSHPSSVLRKEAFTLRSRVLLACPPGDAAAARALRGVAHAAALAFIANPAQFSCDMFASPPVAALRGCGDEGAEAAHALLDAMLRGDLAAFEGGDFDAVVKAAGAAHDDVLDKMRMMALLALCAERAGAAVPFADVEAALHAPAGTAEAWLVRAFGKQLLDGRIDQVAQEVRVRRCERPTFSAAEWHRLARDLDAWRGGLAAVESQMKDTALLAPTAAIQPWLSS